MRDLNEKGHIFINPSSRIRLQTAIELVLALVTKLSAFRALQGRWTFTGNT